jgi:hypothetical protein
MKAASGPPGPGVEVQFAARVDCEKNGCETKHGDDGEIFLRSDEPTGSINGHAVTVLKRTVTYSEWEDVDRCPKCGHGWTRHEQPIRGMDLVECDAYVGMGDWCGCEEKRPWNR